jgi:hypothetical protein
VPQESSIFKSALNPLRLTFKTANGVTSKIIYKKGDDLRQDQLVSNQCCFTYAIERFNSVPVCTQYHPHYYGSGS